MINTTEFEDLINVNNELDLMIKQNIKRDELEKNKQIFNVRFAILSKYDYTTFV